MRFVEATGLKTCTLEKAFNFVIGRFAVKLYPDLSSKVFSISFLWGVKINCKYYTIFQM